MNASMQKPVTELVRDVFTDVQEIVRSEIRLAKAEAKEYATSMMSGVKLTAMGAILGLYAFGLLLLAAVLGLGMTMQSWAAALIVGLVVGLPAAVMILMGMNRLTGKKAAEEHREAKNQQQGGTWNGARVATD
ncbi:MAG: phage holin family protein [Bryobacterales bacterium]|nr:phage holin family protein [Bryobacterales bacterium]